MQIPAFRPVSKKAYDYVCLGNWNLFEMFSEFYEWNIYFYSNFKRFIQHPEGSLFPVSIF